MFIVILRIKRNTNNSQNYKRFIYLGRYVFKEIKKSKKVKFLECYKRCILMQKLNNTKFRVNICKR